MSSQPSYKYQVGDLVIIKPTAIDNPSLIGAIAKVEARGSLLTFGLIVYRLEGFSCYICEEDLDPIFTI